MAHADKQWKRWRGGGERQDEKKVKRKSMLNINYTTVNLQ